MKTVCLLTGLVVLLTVAVFLPSFVPARDTARLNSIIINLRILEGAKDQWALDRSKKTGEMPLESDLTLYLNNGRMPAVVVGESYKIHPVGSNSTAVAQVKLGSIPTGSAITIP